MPVCERSTRPMTRFVGESSTSSVLRRRTSAAASVALLSGLARTACRVCATLSGNSGSTSSAAKPAATSASVEVTSPVCRSATNRGPVQASSLSVDLDSELSPSLRAPAAKRISS
eukprot:Amastigsp_a845410_13.p3 type:complete len:115 gc:universal Amastigsp_a845410_13:619-275(-)